MNSNRTKSRFYTSYSLDSQSNNNNNNQEKNDDNLSLHSLNIELNHGLHYLNTYLNSRQTSNKRSIINHKDSNGNGLIINGLLFDEQLFQPSRSSYIIDYSKTPDDLNQFLQGHNSPSSPTQIDAHLYKLVFILTLTEWNIDKEILLGSYPYDKLEDISYYKQFCFPELNLLEKTTNDQSTYIFTRTLSNGQVEYGYCRRITKYYNQITNFPIVFCIVSTHSYFKLYDAILTELITVYQSNEFECNALMQSFYSKPLPIPTINSSGITCILNDRRLFFYICPRDERLNHDYYSTLLSCLSSSQIIYLFESMLRSKRILIFSKTLSKLTKSCLGLSHLIYPFIWPYSFVSLMPSSWLDDLLDSPCPFIYGCLSERKQEILLRNDNDIIYVDLDLSTIEGYYETTYLFPLNLRQTLEASLEYLKKYRLNKLNINLINIAVSEACLSVFIELFYRLPDYFKRQKLSIENEGLFSICSDYFNRHDSGVDLQSLVSIDTQRKQEENHVDYEFYSEEFLRVQPTPAYILFLKGFIHGMIFLKFLDDYQRHDQETIEIFSLFSQRLNERRQMTTEDLLINPFIRYRQIIDLLDNQIKQASKQTNPLVSKFIKKFFE